MWPVYRFQTKASEEAVVVASTDSDTTLSSTLSTTHPSRTASWLSKMQNSLVKQYNQQENYEAKSRVLKRFEQTMEKTLQTSFHNTLESMAVRVDAVDTTIKSLYYIRFSDSLADYSYSTSFQNLKRNAQTYKLLRNLKEGSTTTINFYVRSLKINDPTGPLATFEMEAVPLPLK